MDKRALLERIRTFWPEAIMLHAHSGQDALNNIYWPLEERLNDADDWTQLAAWAFHQALWELAGSRGGVGEATLRPADVSFEAFDRWMKKNLSDETWANVRKDYDAILD